MVGTFRELDEIETIRSVGTMLSKSQLIIIKSSTVYREEGQECLECLLLFLYTHTGGKKRKMRFILSSHITVAAAIKCTVWNFHPR